MGFAKNLTWGVIVMETADIVPRRNADKPNLFVKTFQGDQGTRAKYFPRRKSTLGKNFLRVRLDLCPEVVFLTEKLAKQQRDEVARSLARSGYTVNPVKDSRYAIYVLELEQQTSGKTRLYVGQTSKPVEIRLQEHLSGIRSSRKVRNQFVRRVLELEPKERYFSKWDAEAEETAFGQKLVELGFEIVGPQDLVKTR